jgi:hypothetical protein
VGYYGSAGLGRYQGNGNIETRPWAQADRTQLVCNQSRLGPSTLAMDIDSRKVSKSAMERFGVDRDAYNYSIGYISYDY